MLGVAAPTGFEGSTVSPNDAYKELLAKGWSLGTGGDFVDGGDATNQALVSVACTKGGRNDGKWNWFGFGLFAVVGTLSKTSTGAGTEEITFGNCWGAGVVNLYQNGAKIATAPPQSWLTEEVTVQSGDVLELKDEGGNAVISLVSWKSATAAPGDEMTMIQNAYSNLCTPSFA